MSDKELADKIVALGVGCDDNGLYGLPNQGMWMLRAEFFVRDWRVAGALMEKVIEWGGFDFVGSCTIDTFQATAYRGYGHLKKINHGVNESLPRAICEACVEALESEND